MWIIAEDISSVTVQALEGALYICKVRIIAEDFSSVTDQALEGALFICKARIIAELISSRYSEYTERNTRFSYSKQIQRSAQFYNALPNLTSLCQFGESDQFCYSFIGFSIV